MMFYMFLMLNALWFLGENFGISLVLGRLQKGIIFQFLRAIKLCLKQNLTVKFSKYLSTTKQHSSLMTFGMKHLVTWRPPQWKQPETCTLMLISFLLNPTPFTAPHVLYQNQHTANQPRLQFLMIRRSYTRIFVVPFL